MYRKLEFLDQEYYYLAMQSKPMSIGRLKRLLWVLLFFMAFIEFVIIVTLNADPSIPSFLQVLVFVSLFLAACYGVLVVIVSFGKTLQRHFRFRICLLFAGYCCALFSFWAVATTVMCAQDNATLYLAGQLIVLVVAALFTIGVIKHTTNQIVKGYYREGRGGFFGEHHGFVEKLLSPFVGVSAGGVSAAAVGWAMFLNRIRPKTDPVPWWVAPLSMSLLLLLFCMLSVLTSRTLLWFHMNRKFGFEMPLLDNEEKGSKKR
jgi:hypothetical protein